jgi:ethanolamine utilization microcompartment shell protein EutS
VGEFFVEIGSEAAVGTIGRVALVPVRTVIVASDISGGHSEFCQRFFGLAVPDLAGEQPLIGMF